jgi:pantothenate kinase-related protein Tda10
MDDVFNNENESFQQETKLMENEYSVNLRTKFYYKNKWNDGWINIVNPFRATIVLGTPGSGKSYAIVNSYIKQQIEKGFSMYIYDFKFDDLSTIAYNHLLKHRDKQSSTQTTSSTLTTHARATVVIRSILIL